MKDSGIEWIGEIPESWCITKCKRILSANDGGVWGNDPTGSDEDKIVIRSTEQTIDGKWCIENPAKRDLHTVSYSECRIQYNDLLITKSSGSDLHIGKTTLADEYFITHECYYSNFIQRIRSETYNSKLLWYLFNSIVTREQFVYLQNTTSGLGNINAEIINNICLPVPPSEKQQAISGHLDRQCALIDSVIEKTKASIEEYKKLRQAVITQAVTKGVRGDRPMKDSGIEWIGEIPEEWEVSKLKFYIKLIESGTSVNAGQEEAHEGQYGVLKTSSVSKQVFNAHENKNVNPEEYSRVSCPVKANTVIVSRMNTPELVGACGYVDKDYPNIFLPDRLWQVHFHDNVCVRFIYYWLISSGIRYYYASLAVGTSSSMQNISQDQFYNAYWMIPSISEQSEIAAYLDKKCVEIDALIAKKETFLAELEAYKKSLIYEYVTGKKEVPQA